MCFCSSTGVTTVVVWTIMLKSVAFHLSQRDVIAVKVSHTWWPSVPTRGRCLPPRLRTPTAPPPLLSPRKRRAGRARRRRRAPRPLRRKRVSAALTLSAGGRAGTERNLSTEPSRLTGSLWLSPHLDGARSQKSTTSHARVTKETLPPVQLWYQSMGITRRRVCFQ